jgi:copper(I)-binding protein
MRHVEPASEYVAAAVVRAWIEAGQPGALKVRITTDVDGQLRTVGVASSIDNACAIIRTWLEGLVWPEAIAKGDRDRPS